MSLVIGRWEGQDVFVGDLRVMVTEVIDKHSYVITVYGSVKAKHLITAGSSIAVGYVDGALIHFSCGSRGSSTLARVMVSAPRRIRVLRGELYRQNLLSDYGVGLPIETMDALYLINPERTARDWAELIKESTDTEIPDLKMFQDYLFKFKGSDVVSVSLEPSNY